MASRKPDEGGENRLVIGRAPAIGSKALLQRFFRWAIVKSLYEDGKNLPLDLNYIGSWNRLVHAWSRWDSVDLLFRSASCNLKNRRPQKQRSALRPRINMLAQVSITCRQDAGATVSLPPQPCRRTTLPRRFPAGRVAQDTALAQTASTPHGVFPPCLLPKPEKSPAWRR